MFEAVALMAATTVIEYLSYQEPFTKEEKREVSTQVNIVICMIVQAIHEIQHQRDGPFSRALLSSTVRKVDVETILERHPGEGARVQVRRHEATIDKVKRERDNMGRAARDHKSMADTFENRLEDAKREIEDLKTKLAIAQNEKDANKRDLQAEREKTKHQRVKGGAGKDELRVAEAKLEAEQAKSKGEQKLYEGEQLVARMRSETENVRVAREIRYEARNQKLVADCEKKMEAMEAECETKYKAIELEKKKSRKKIQHEKEAVTKKLEKEYQIVRLDCGAERMGQLETEIADALAREADKDEKIYDLEKDLANTDYTLEIAEDRALSFEDMAEKYKGLYLTLLTQQEGGQ